MVQIGAVDKDSKYAKKQHQNLVSVANENYFGIQEQLARACFFIRIPSVSLLDTIVISIK